MVVPIDHVECGFRIIRSEGDGQPGLLTGTVLDLHLRAFEGIINEFCQLADNFHPNLVSPLTILGFLSAYLRR
jgi:hypothetical protein